MRSTGGGGGGWGGGGGGGGGGEWVSPNNLLVSMQTFDEAERHLWRSMEGEWQLEKERILNSLLGPGPDLMEVPSEPEVGIN